MALARREDVARAIEEGRSNRFMAVSVIMSTSPWRYFLEQYFIVNVVMSVLIVIISLFVGFWKFDNDTYLLVF